MPFQRDPHEPIAHIVRELDELMAAGSEQDAFFDALLVAQAAIERAANTPIARERRAVTFLFRALDAIDSAQIG